MADTMGDRRHSNNVQTLALYITVLANVIALAWAAATITAQVGTIRETLRPLVSDVAQLKIDDAIQRDRESRRTGDK